MLKNIVVLCITIASANAQHAKKYFPHNPNELDTNQPVSDPVNLYDSHHGIAMGVVDSSCDDGQVNLQIDWLDNVENYTCFENKRLYLPQTTLHPITSMETIPPEYSAPHKCMNESIEYDEIIPTFGTHRPLWAIYGEYYFLPRQRWLHNLEHGGVVMLYHPCADANEIFRLKKIVKNCLYRHVITPYNLLSQTRPLALVTWGHRMEMSVVSPNAVLTFIRDHALRGPEKTARNGQYDYKLKEPAHVVSDEQDTILCPRIADISVEGRK